VTDENEWEIKSVLAFAFEGEVDPFMHPVLSRGHQVKETRCKRHVTAAAKCQPKKKKTLHSFNFPAQVDPFFLNFPAQLDPLLLVPLALLCSLC
jgi:hypothetical protein